jgi:hypothetical protein
LTGDYLIFLMPPTFRTRLISHHKFYVEQAKNRLLSQFENIENEADHQSEEWLNNNGHLFGQETYHSSEMQRLVNNERDERYRLLKNMQDDTCLSVAAGMFYESDKQLRNWLVEELKRVDPFPATISAIWKASFDELMNLLGAINLPVREREYFKDLDACRLVVNVHKHGSGPAFDKLKTDCPEFFGDALSGTTNFGDQMQYMDHTNVKIKKEHLDRFSEAIIRLWLDLPAETWESQIKALPKWFENAVNKDKERSNLKSFWMADSIL